MAKEKGINNVSFQQGDILDLPFESASFDHIFGSFIVSGR
ncbi:class I SAM-dependent methyltransferase [Candidatus Thiosymbion oneisti]